MSNHLSHDTRETGAPCVSFSPCVRGWRVQERGDLLAANTRETGELFERRSRMEADFMERFLAAVEGYQGVLEALRVADAEDYHILKIRWVSVRDDHRAPPPWPACLYSSEPRHTLPDRTHRVQRVGVRLHATVVVTVSGLQLHSTCCSGSLALVYRTDRMSLRSRIGLH